AVLQTNLKHAEIEQGLAKEEKPQIGVELVRVTERFIAPRRGGVSTLTPEEKNRVEEARRNLESLGYTLEDIYPSFNENNLWQIVNNAVLQNEPTAYFVRGPPDTFYVIRASGDGKVQVIKILSEYLPTNAKTEVSFNGVLKASGRTVVKRKSDMIQYFPFKCPQDSFSDHQLGNDWITLENLGLYDVFKPGQNLLTKEEIIQMLLRATEDVNSHTMKKGKEALSFRVLFDATVISTDDIEITDRTNIARALMPILEKISASRENVVRLGLNALGRPEERRPKDGKVSHEVKSFIPNRENMDRIDSEINEMNEYRRVRDKKELDRLDRIWHESFERLKTAEISMQDLFAEYFPDENIRRREMQHARNVADVVALLGEKIGLPQNVIRELRIGAFLHDIGKEAFPEVGTPEIFTPERREEIRKGHVLRTLEILKEKGIKLSEDVMRAIEEHHMYGPKSTYGEIFFLADGLVARIDVMRPHKRLQNAELQEVLQDSARVINEDLREAISPRLRSAILDLIDARDRNLIEIITRVINPAITTGIIVTEIKKLVDLLETKKTPGKYTGLFTRYPSSLVIHGILTEEDRLGGVQVRVMQAVEAPGKGEHYWIEIEDANGSVIIIDMFPELNFKIINEIMGDLDRFEEITKRPIVISMATDKNGNFIEENSHYYRNMGERQWNIQEEDRIRYQRENIKKLKQSLSREENAMIEKIVANIQSLISQKPKDHAGFGIRMTGDTYVEETIFERTKEYLRMQIRKGVIPEGFSRETVTIEGHKIDVVVHEGALSRFSEQGRTLQQFIEHSIQIRGPTYKRQLIEGLKGKTLVIDLVPASPNLYGNRKRDDYIYINENAPLELDPVGVSHELMHEAGIFTDSDVHESELTGQDIQIISEHNLLGILNKLVNVDKSSILFIFADTHPVILSITAARGAVADRKKNIEHDIKRLAAIDFARGEANLPSVAALAMELENAEERLRELVMGDTTVEITILLENIDIAMHFIDDLDFKLRNNTLRFIVGKPDLPEKELHYKDLEDIAPLLTHEITDESAMTRHFENIEEKAIDFVPHVKWPDRPYVMFISGNDELASDYFSIMKVFQRRVDKVYQFGNIIIYIVKDKKDLKKRLEQAERIFEDYKDRDPCGLAFLGPEMSQMIKDFADRVKVKGEGRFLHIKTQYPQDAYYHVSSLLEAGIGILDYRFNHNEAHKHPLIDLINAITGTPYITSDNLEDFLRGALPLILPKIDRNQAWLDLRKWINRDKQLGASL
ncbi:MAG: HD domain-containing protein, partial [Candidatus Omnitrophica bacterium]|nr:HD domain-containing protein [Candidatus Omnitrophota bacterium]